MAKRINHLRPLISACKYAIIEKTLREKIGLILPLMLTWTLTFGSTGVLAKDFEFSQKGGGYEFEVKMDRNPPIIGDNRIEIALNNEEGKPVADAQVLINYYMPPMPRMVPMNYTASAQFKHGRYEAILNFIMAGPWIIRVIVTRDDKRTVAKFNVDAQ